MSSADSVPVGAFLAQKGLVNIGQFTGLALGGGLLGAAQGQNLALNVDPPGGFLGDVANLAALTASDDNVPNNSIRRVGTLLQNFWLDKTSTATVDGITVVATLSGVGRWIRDVAPVPHWTNQLLWDVDATAGNDENSGIAGSGAPIKTVAEFCRRLKALNSASYTANLLTNIPSTDSYKLLSDLPNPGATPPLVTMKGTRTVISSSAFTATADTVVATNTQASVTDASVTWAAQLGRRLVATSGAGVGGEAIALKDLGAGAVRVSTWCNPATGVLTANPAALDTYQLVSETDWAADIRGISNNIGTKVTMAFTNLNITTTGLVPDGTVLTFNACRLGVAVAAPGNIFLGTGQVTYTCCAFVFGSVTRYIGTNGPFIAILGGGAVNTRFEVNRTGSLRFTNFCINGGSVRTFVSAIGLHFPGGSIVVPSSTAVRGGLGIFDSPDWGMSISRKTNCVLNGALYGSGNTTGGFQAPDTGNMMILSTITPTLTGAIELQMDGFATALPALEASAGLVLPAASALATWAQWAAAPFSRNVMSYKTGSSITSFT